MARRSSRRIGPLLALVLGVTLLLVSVAPAALSSRGTASGGMIERATVQTAFSGPSGTTASGPRFGPLSLPGLNDPTPHIEIANFSVGTFPSPAIYDPVNGYLYVANTDSDNVSVIDATTNQVVESIPVGGQPKTPVLDAGSDELFVPNYASANVTVISGASNTVIANVPVGPNPYPGADDSTNGEVYIPDYGDSNITVIQAVHPHVVANISVGSNPQPPTFDSLNNTIFVPNQGTDNVSVISGVTNTVVKTINRQPTQILNTPETMAFDPVNGDLYVPSGFFSADSPVTVINGTTYVIVATPIVGGYPSPPTYDPVNGNIYVSNYYSTSDNVSVISGVSNTVVASVPAGNQPLTPAVDTANGNVYVPNSSNVTIISGATSSVLLNVTVTYQSGGDYYNFAPQTPTFDPANGEVYVPNLDGTHVAVLGFPPAPTYSVTFSEMGLPAHETWTVSVDSSSKSMTTDGGIGQLQWTGLANDSYTYVITDISGWHQSTLPYTGSVVVNGGATVESTLVYTQVTYSVTFQEMGLPAGESWNVSVASISKILTTDTSTDALEWTGLANGSSSYRVTDISGWHQNTLPYAGMVQVSGGSVVETTLVYTEVTYSVTFTETGLPAGTPWTLTFNGAPEQGSGTTVTVPVANGSYPFTVGAVSGYSASPASGTVPVHGASVPEAITFSSTTSPSTSSTSWLDYLLIGVIVVIALIVLLLAVFRRRKPPPKPTTSPGPPPPAH